MKAHSSPTVTCFYRIANRTQTYSQLKPVSQDCTEDKAATKKGATIAGPGCSGHFSRQDACMAPGDATPKATQVRVFRRTCGPLGPSLGLSGRLRTKLLT